jgi:hypothetical protein
MSRGHHCSVQVNETVSQEVNNQVEVHQELLHHDRASHRVFEVNTQGCPGEAAEIVVDASLAKRAQASLRGLSLLPSVAELVRHVH